MRLWAIGVAAVATVTFFNNVGGSGPARSDAPIAIPDAAPGASPTAPRAVKENVIAYHTGDMSIQEARAKARTTLPRFVDLIEAGTQGTYTVKFPLTQNGTTEHIWMQLVDLQGDTFVGLLANDPVNGTKYKMGDRVEVASRDVEDWMIRSPDAMYGGYSVRAMLKNLPKEQADKLRPMFRD